MKTNKEPKQRPGPSRLTSSLTKRTQTAHEDTVAQAVQLAASAVVPTFRGPLHESSDQTNPAHENERQGPTESHTFVKAIPNSGSRRKIQNEPGRTSGSSGARPLGRTARTLPVNCETNPSVAGGRGLWSRGETNPRVHTGKNTHATGSDETNPSCRLCRIVPDCARSRWHRKSVLRDALWLNGSTRPAGAWLNRSRKACVFSDQRNLEAE